MPNPAAMCDFLPLVDAMTLFHALDFSEATNTSKLEISSDRFVTETLSMVLATSDVMITKLQSLSWTIASMFSVRPSTYTTSLWACVIFDVFTNFTISFLYCFGAIYLM